MKNRVFLAGLVCVLLLFAGLAGSAFAEEPAPGPAPSDGGGSAPAPGPAPSDGGGSAPAPGPAPSDGGGGGAPAPGPMPGSAPSDGGGAMPGPQPGPDYRPPMDSGMQQPMQGQPGMQNQPYQQMPFKEGETLPADQQGFMPFNNMGERPFMNQPGQPFDQATGAEGNVQQPLMRPMGPGQMGPMQFGQPGQQMGPGMQGQGQPGQQMGPERMKFGQPGANPWGDCGNPGQISEEGKCKECGYNWCPGSRGSPNDCYMPGQNCKMVTEGAMPVNQPTQWKPEMMQKQDQPKWCGDGLCDEYETASKGCPEDCHWSEAEMGKKPQNTMMFDPQFQKEMMKREKYREQTVMSQMDFGEGCGKFLPPGEEWKVDCEKNGGKIRDGEKDGRGCLMPPRCEFPQKEINFADMGMQGMRADAKMKCKEIKDGKSGMIRMDCGRPEFCPVDQEIVDAEMARAKDKCLANEGTPIQKVDGRNCNFVECIFGEMEGEMNFFKAVEKKGPCPAPEALDQAMRKCEDSGMKGVIVASSDGCKISKCVAGTQKMFNCKEIPVEEKKQLFADCNAKGGKLVKQFEQGCPIPACVTADEVESKCQPVPEDAYAKCGADGGQLIVREDENGCPTFVNCVMRGDRNNIEFKKVTEVPDVAVLMSMALKLEALNIEFDKLSKQTLTIADYYGSIEDTQSQERFTRVSSMFGDAKTKIDEVRASIRDNMNSMTPDKMLEIKHSIKYLKEVTLQDILFVMLGGELAEREAEAGDVALITEVKDCGYDGMCFMDAFSICEKVTFQPEDAMSLEVKGVDEEGNCVMKVSNVNMPDKIYMDCKISDYSTVMPGPDTILPYCEGPLKEMASMGGPNQGGPGMGGPGMGGPNQGGPGMGGPGMGPDMGPSGCERVAMGELDEGSCGNMCCEGRFGETRENCPNDCMSGGRRMGPQMGGPGMGPQGMGPMMGPQDMGPMIPRVEETEYVEPTQSVESVETTVETAETTTEATATTETSTASAESSAATATTETATSTEAAATGTA